MANPFFGFFWAGEVEAGADTSANFLARTDDRAAISSDEELDGAFFSSSTVDSNRFFLFFETELDSDLRFRLA